MSKLGVSIENTPRTRGLQWYRDPRVPKLGVLGNPGVPPGLPPRYAPPLAVVHLGVIGGRAAQGSRSGLIVNLGLISVSAGAPHPPTLVSPQCVGGASG